MTDRLCPLCSATLAPGAELCPKEVGRTRTWLDAVPAILRDLELTITRQTSKTDGGSGEDRLDWNERAALADQALRDVLERFSGRWARETRIRADQAPAVARLLGTGPGRAALLRSADLSGRPWAPDLALELDTACEEAQAATDRPPDTRFIGWCLGPDRNRPTCNRALYAREGELATVCPGCHTSWPVEASRTVLLAAATTETADATTLGRALNVPPSTIRGWKREGRLAQATRPDGDLAYNAAGQPLYVVAHVQALANGNRPPRQVPSAGVSVPDGVLVDAQDLGERADDMVGHGPAADEPLAHVGGHDVEAGGERGDGQVEGGGAVE